MFFTIRIKCFNIIHIVHIFRSTLFGGRSGDSEEQGKISQFQALSTALAASMGTGNIVGVAAALSVGGPGAIFWMWISAAFCTAIAFGENVLGVRYKNKGGDSPMSYISEAIHPKAALLYGAVCVLASFGIGNMTQTNALASAAAELGISCKAAGLATAFLCGLMIFRGAKNVAAAAEKIIPLISLLYLAAGVTVMVIFRNNIIEVLKLIFSSAIGYSQVIGGISGTAIKKAVSVGLRRGIFSNEAGMGSSVLVHTETDCREPVRMGMWAVAEVVIDTIICCSLTAFVILLTGADSSGTEGLAMAAEGFQRGLGEFAGYFTAGSAVIFAFCTLLGWYFYGEKCLLYIVRNGNKKAALFFYRAAYTAAAFIGAVSGLELIWGMADIFNWLMMVINLAAVIVLNGEIVKSTREYTNSIKQTRREEDKKRHAQGSTLNS
ncbi:MAG: sodium:alanine symporter family protein [Oscillospiraceae bacterium]|nr:sodium:alanine symporter family protein [Oscillospiraceae bacterium]